MSRKLTALARITPEEAWLLVQSSLLLPVIAISLHVAGFARTYQWLYRPTIGESNSHITTVSRSVNRAANNLPGFNPTCLPRSLVLWHLLRRSGATAELRIGVAKQGDTLAAHAWVESDGQVINDRQDIAHYYSPIDFLSSSTNGE